MFGVIISAIVVVAVTLICMYMIGSTLLVIANKISK